MPQLWIKLHPIRIFESLLPLQLNIAQFGLLTALVGLAKICPVVEIFSACKRMPFEHAEKLISMSEYQPYPKELLANKFGVTVDWLEKGIDKLKEIEEIRQDERGIWIVTWEEHQGDYDRQALYRQNKIHSGDRRYKITNPVCPACNCGDHVWPDPELKKQRNADHNIWRCQTCGAVYDPDTKKWEERHEKSAPQKKRKARQT